MAAPEPQTWGDLLRHGTAALRQADGPTPHLDASVLLGHLLDVPRTALLAHPTREAAPEIITAYADLIARRAAGEPVAYLTGHRDFMGLDIKVDRRVLVPRPETELVVEAALGALSDRLGPLPDATDTPAEAAPLPDILAADIGTGSGAIAIALASLDTRIGRVYAVEQSAAALEVARHNGDRLGVSDRVSWLLGDLLAALPTAVDLIVANLPYVPDQPGAAEPNVVAYEPHDAVFGPDADGLGLIRRLIAQAPSKLRPAGILVMEHGYDQRAAIAVALAEVFPTARMSFGKDYAGWDRYVVVHT